MTPPDKDPVQVPLRPARHVEHRVIEAILDGTHEPGSALPPERRLAERLGVTRPTVREALHRLAAEGWITIRHGRPTRVNNYWETGGLALLGTLVKHSDLVPGRLILHLLDFRVIMLPPAAGCAAEKAPERMADLLEERKNLQFCAESFSAYDWNLQVWMARLSQNPIYSMILNDFEAIFTVMGKLYFSRQKARAASMDYYRRLSLALADGAESVKRVVRSAMQESISIWKQINPAETESENETLERLGR